MAGKPRRPIAPTEKKSDAKARRNAEHVALRLARDRSLVKLPAERPDPKTGELVTNPLAGRKLKGQHRAPRQFEKEVLRDVANVTGVSERTLERHYSENKSGAEGRISKRIADNMREKEKAGRRLLNESARFINEAIALRDKANALRNLTIFRSLAEASGDDPASGDVRRAMEFELIINSLPDK